MSERTGAPLGWLRVQRWRARVLRHDGARLLGGIVQALRWAVWPPPAHPSLSLLEGSPLAARGAPSDYRVRVHNPTFGTRSVTLVVRGWQAALPSPIFEARCEFAIGSRASVERWLRSDWTRQASFSATGPSSVMLPSLATTDTREGEEQWIVEAELEENGRLLERLRIGGFFAASQLDAGR